MLPNILLPQTKFLAMPLVERRIIAYVVPFRRSVAVMRRPNINLGASETLKDGTNSVGTAAGLAPLPFRPHGRVFRILCVKRHCSCSLALVNNVSVCTVLAN